MNIVDSAYTINVRGRLLSLASPQVMGILNVTPDSFYAASRQHGEDEVARRADEIVGEGGAIIDVGAFSTRPGAAEVSEAEEMRRLRMALGVVSHRHPDAVVSVDTFRPDVARMAVEEYGAAIINDVTGFRDEAMVQVARNCEAGLVVMHMGGDDPRTMQDNPTYTDVVAEVAAWLDIQASVLQTEGIAHDRICIDPGPGFGKDANTAGKDKAMKSLQQFLRPEFIGRVDEVILFNSLSLEDYEKIAALLIGDFIPSLQDKGIRLNIGEGVAHYIAKEAVNGIRGARDIRHTIRRMIEDPITNLLVSSYDKPIAEINVAQTDQGISVTPVYQ